MWYIFQVLLGTSITTQKYRNSLIKKKPHKKRPKKPQTTKPPGKKKKKTPTNKQKKPTNKQTKKNYSNNKQSILSNVESKTSWAIFQVSANTVDTWKLYLPRAGHSTVTNTSPHYKLISWVFNILMAHWAQMRLTCLMVKLHLRSPTA